MTEEKQRNSIWRVVFRFVDKPKSKERPFVVLIAVGDRIQGFRMTSRSWRDGDIRFYEIKNLDGTGLTEDTWVDLESVFPPEEDFVEYMGELNPEDRLGMQRQLKQYLEMLMKGPVCGCKIGEKFGLDNAGVTAKVAPMVESGIVIETKDLEWNKYRIGETNMCLLNKYFNDQIDACRSTGCKCKCGENCC